MYLGKNRAWRAVLVVLDAREATLSVELQPLCAVSKQTAVVAEVAARAVALLPLERRRHGEARATCALGAMHSCFDVSSEPAPMLEFATSDISSVEIVQCAFAAALLQPSEVLGGELGEGGAGEVPASR